MSKQYVSPEQAAQDLQEKRSRYTPATNVKLRNLDIGKVKGLIQGQPGLPRYILALYDDLYDNIMFHYNPGEWAEEIAANYKDGDEVGSVRPVKQFVNGGDRKFSMQLFLNEYGEKASETNKKSVEDTIKWLVDKQKPYGNTHTPRPLLFIPNMLGPYRVIISGMKVKRTVFSSTGFALRAYVDIVLTESLDTITLAKAQAVIDNMGQGEVQ